jgi:hypothetical protein
MEMGINVNDVIRGFDGAVKDYVFDPICEAKHFFEAIYGSWQKDCQKQYLEIRLIGDGRVEQRFYSSPDEFITYDLRALLKAQERGKYDIFFGVCPRSRKSGKNEDIAIIPALWADIDDGGSFGKLMAFSPRSDIIVFSGHGYHAYWLLNKPVPANQNTQGTLRKIQKACGSDSVSDFARVMRLPGSLNLKEPQNPKLCKVVFTGGGNGF